MQELGQTTTFPMIPNTRAPDSRRRFVFLSDCFLRWHCLLCKPSPPAVGVISAGAWGVLLAACCVKWIRCERSRAGGREVKGHHGSR